MFSIILKCFGFDRAVTGLNFEPITLSAYLVYAGIASAIAGGGASIYGGYKAGEAQDNQLAYQKEQDSYNNLRIKRSDAFNRRQTLYQNKLASRQLAMQEEQSAWAKKKDIMYTTTQILDWFDGRQEKKALERRRKAVGEFGIMPVAPLTKTGA